MENLDSLRELRSLISKARESCAGSDLNNRDRVAIFTSKAVHVAVSLGFIDIARKLNEVMFIVCTDLTDEKRLGADGKLCSILNNIDKQIKIME